MRTLLCNKCQNELISDVHFPLIPDDVLRANQHPSEQEKLQTLSFIEGEAHELHKCDQEISRLLKIVGELQEHRRVLEGRLERRRSWLSGVRRLPVEILEEIFAMVCLSEEPEQSLHGSPDVHSMTPTLTLAHVSHHWRQTVRASPRLWSSIKVVVSPTYNARPLLEHYLTNSKDYPLDLTLSGKFPAVDFILRQNVFVHGLMVIDLLTDNCSRIERLTLDEADVVAFLPPPNNLPSLRFFRNSRNSIPAEGPIWSILGRAQQLTNVSTDTLLPRSFLPYSQLTSLEITGSCGCRQLLATLKVCTSLQSLELRNITSLHDQDLWDLVQLGSLTHFAVTAHSNDDLVVLFHHLNLPALTSLRVTEFDDPKDDTLLPILGLIRRSGCKISELSLNMSWICDTGEDLVDFLELCPNLSRLEVEVWEVSADRRTISYQLLDAIQTSHSASEGILVPNLVQTTIIEHQSSVGEDVVVALLDMMEPIFTSRMISKEPSIRPWNLDITFGGPCTAEAVQAWEDRRGGLTHGIKCKIGWDSRTHRESEVDQ